jgi:hypothetical protein
MASDIDSADGSGVRSDGCRQHLGQGSRPGSVARRGRVDLPDIPSVATNMTTSMVTERIAAKLTHEDSVLEAAQPVAREDSRGFKEQGLAAIFRSVYIANWLKKYTLTKCRLTTCAPCRQPRRIIMSPCCRTTTNKKKQDSIL